MVIWLKNKAHNSLRKFINIIYFLTIVCNSVYENVYNWFNYCCEVLFCYHTLLEWVINIITRINILNIYIFILQFCSSVLSLQWGFPSHTRLNWIYSPFSHWYRLSEIVPTDCSLVALSDINWAGVITSAMYVVVVSIKAIITL